jgi:hypothetical protein
VHLTAERFRWLRHLDIIARRLARVAVLPPLLFDRRT